jgi:hydrogenase nickel incorporation protein HypA/HybF
MHESSLLKGLFRKINTLAAEHNAPTIARVKIQLGALTNISADHFREHFTHAAVGTPAAGAQLDIEMLTDPADPRALDIILTGIEIPDQ